MKRLLILFALLTLMIPSGRLFAAPSISFSDWIIQNIWKRMQGRDPSVTAGRHELSTAPGLPAGCREEACHSVPDPIAGLANCHRTICGGNFWGESATDMMENGAEISEKTGATYKPYRIRLPKREYSNDPWQTIYIQTRGPYWTCGTHLKSSLKIKGAMFHSLFDLFVPPLLADPPNQFPPLSEDNKRDLAPRLNDLAWHINGYRARYDPGSEQERYFETTEAAAAFLAHEFDPSTYPCPPGLGGLCGQVDNLHVNFQDLPGGRYGQTTALNEIDLDYHFSFPADTVVITDVLDHEAAHIISAYENDYYDSESLELAVPEGEPTYASETEAIITEAIAHQFQELDEAGEPTGGRFDQGFDFAEMNNDYQLFLRDPSLARMGSVAGNPAYTYDIVVPLLPESTRQALDRLYGDDREAITSALIRADSNGAYYRLAERQFLERGGYQGLSVRLPHHVTFGTPTILSSLQHRNFVSAAPHQGPGTPVNLTVGNPPGSRASPDPNIGHRPNLPGYTPPDLSNRVPSNVATRQNPGDVTAWCRSHPGGACNPPPVPTPAPPGSPSDGGGGGGTGSGRPFNGYSCLGGTSSSYPCNPNGLPCEACEAGDSGCPVCPGSAGSGGGGGYPCTDCPPGGGGGSSGGGGGPFHEGEGNGGEGGGDGPHGEVFIPPD